MQAGESSLSRALRMASASAGPRRPSSFERAEGLEGAAMGQPAREESETGMTIGS